MNEIKTLEHATLKVPYEMINKEFRTAQKIIDREMSYISTSCSEIRTLLVPEGSPPVPQSKRIALSYSPDQPKRKSSLSDEEEEIQHVKSRPMTRQASRKAARQPATVIVVASRDDEELAAPVLPSSLAPDVKLPTSTEELMQTDIPEDFIHPEPSMNIINNELPSLAKQMKLSSDCASTSIPSAPVVSALKGLIDKLAVFKKKSMDAIDEEMKACDGMRRRIDHLTAYNPAKMTDAEVDAWRSTRLQRMLVDHMLRNNYYESAKHLAAHNNIEDLTNINLFLITRDVELDLIKHGTSKCLSWCYDNKSKLRKMKSTLEFNLRRQEFVELIKQDKRLDAVRHAQRYFGPLQVERMPDVQSVMGLLAFPVDTKQEPYATLFAESSWDTLLAEFKQDSYTLYQLSNYSSFSLALQAGLSALKTPQCYVHPKTPTPTPSCSQPTPTLAPLTQHTSTPAPLTQPPSSQPIPALSTTTHSSSVQPTSDHPASIQYSFAQPPSSQTPSSQPPSSQPPSSQPSSSQPTSSIQIPSTLQSSSQPSTAQPPPSQAFNTEPPPTPPSPAQPPSPSLASPSRPASAAHSSMSPYIGPPPPPPPSPPPTPPTVAATAALGAAPSIADSSSSVTPASTIAPTPDSAATSLSPRDTPAAHLNAPRNKDCPLCDHLLSKLADTLPFAHCSRSRLVCSISHQRMDDNNIPMMLPNGFVYGINSLKKMNDCLGKIVCPVTNDECDFSELLKVYIM